MTFDEWDYYATPEYDKMVTRYEIVARAASYALVVNDLRDNDTCDDDTHAYLMARLIELCAADPEVLNMVMLAEQPNGWINPDPLVQMAEKRRRELVEKFGHYPLYREYGQILSDYAVENSH